MKPRPDLSDELAATEGEPSSPYACFDPDDIPDDRSGRTVPAADAWRMLLLMGERKDGKGYVPFVKPISANVSTILRRHPQWTGCVAYDEFRECIVTTRPPPWHPEDMPEGCEEGPWGDNDTSRLVAWLARCGDALDVAVSDVERGLAVAADCARRHPVRDYLRALSWDGLPRVDAWCATCLGAPDDEYTRGVGSRWLISAVARIMVPGAQADCTLLLEGPQGAGKTSALRALVPVSEWYADSGLDLSNKDSCDALRSVWIYGLDELDSLRKGEVTKWKTFLTQTRDHYRPPYARRTRDFLRQNVFCGTTNESQYLVDETGSRRFWPIRCGRIDVDAIRRDRDQLWAEAMTRYVADEPWHIDSARLRLLCEEQQGSRQQVDPWVDCIARWLERPVGRDEKDGYPVAIDTSAGVSTTDVLVYACQVPRRELSKGAEMRAGSILRGLGYERRRSPDPDRRWLYVREADELDA